MRGWLKQQIASVQNHVDPIAAQKTLKSAITLNRRLLKPLDGIAYEPLKLGQVNQATGCYKFLEKFKATPNALVLHVQSIVERLKFQPDSADAFERAMDEAGQFIGFSAQRPDRDFKLGPDVLWAVGELKYFLIECKSEATVKLISKAYANQLLHHVQWFKHRYDDTCTCVPILMHPSMTFDYHAIPPTDLRVISAKELNEFCAALVGFATAIAHLLPTLKIEALAERLRHFHLTPPEFVATFTSGFKRID